MQLGLGTAALGRPQYINIRQDASKHSDLKAFKEQSFSVLEKAYELGIRYFDTAPGYGLAEDLLAEWLKTKADSSIRIATKWGYTYVANFKADAAVHEVKEHSLEKLNEQWEVSKNFLPHLKVYQIHSATLETGVLNNEAILNRLAFIKNEHQIEIGVTTTGANQVKVIKRALDVSVEGNQLFDAFQVSYNILDQSLKTISNKLYAQDKKIIIKEALANGRLFKNKNFPHYNDLYGTLERVANKYKVGTDAIALKFCAQNFDKSIVLSGASNIIHLEANLKANDFTLSQDELNHLKCFQLNANDYWQERKQLAWN